MTRKTKAIPPSLKANQKRLRNLQALISFIGGMQNEQHCS